MASGYLDSYMSHLEADPIGVGNTLEAMPAEILQKIFVYSMNVYLPQVSRILRAVLDNEYVRLCFSESVFIEAYWIWHHSTQDREHHACSARNLLLAQPWFTYEFSSKVEAAIRRRISFRILPFNNRPWGDGLFTSCPRKHQAQIAIRRVHPSLIRDEIKLFKRLKGWGAVSDGRVRRSFDILDCGTRNHAHNRGDRGRDTIQSIVFVLRLGCNWAIEYLHHRNAWGWRPLSEMVVARVVKASTAFKDDFWHWVTYG